MQILVLNAGDQAFAIDAGMVVEVLPMVPVKPVPRLPDYVLGMLTYRGEMIPVVDLARRLAGGFAARRLSTRMIVVQFDPTGIDGVRIPRRGVRMGLVGENIVSTHSSADAETLFPAMHLEDAPYLGKILRLEGRTVQMLVVGNILPAELSAGLFAASADGQTR